MGTSLIQAVLWIVAIVLLLLYVDRRRRRKIVP